MMNHIEAEAHCISCAKNSWQLGVICGVMERWTAEKHSLDEEDSSLTDSTLDNVKKLLNYC